jgi:hypothetical protein
MAGETTTTLHGEMLEAPLERATVQAVLEGLVRRGLMSTSRGVYDGVQRSGDGGHAIGRVYEDDWWDVTAAGRRAIGLPCKPPPFWLNPASGPHRRPPLQAALYGTWVRVKSRARWLLDACRPSG